jgi:hypothetical protein
MIGLVTRDYRFGIFCNEEFLSAFLYVVYDDCDHCVCRNLPLRINECNVASIIILHKLKY